MPLAWREMLDELRRADLLVTAPAEGPMTTGIGADSRGVGPGMLYVAVRGSQADGHHFVGDAVRRGAPAVVVEGAQQSGVPEIVVRDGRRAALALGQAWYGHPGRRLTLLGVTGTNGKTTTTGLLRQLLNSAGSAGSIGTLGAFDGRGESVESTAGSLTTPAPIDLQATLADLLARGTTHVTLEASSHSLDQGRLDGLSFRIAVFTNLTRDHLDYHGTMEAYLAAKLTLSRLLSLDGIEVINLDDDAWRDLPPRSPRVTYGLHPAADLRAAGVTLDASGSRFRLEGCFGSTEAALPLLGDFNVSNALGAAAAALALGLPLSDVAGRLAATPQVPGRMERIADTPCIVLRDYAHTPDALERALATLRPLTRGRLIVVFGCGGDRDRGKRPLMGRVAAMGADLAIATSDNPRTEDPGAIIDEIEQGMGDVPHLRITDRLAAIHAGLEAAREGDTLLLAGKGHEIYQVLGTERVPFDERAIVRAATGG
ncbi:MAG: UDP-N-acetylmuramoyl-L-alanyl-D-glutamate--2,6-diaminopimelate ligase, partial [Gemmatimonadales bacterium]|nr:UDP-N-acetylmuramoyl-L-alanyl-D-glutamate--2,6-diaminopimelate ligase [Gemmatimonadales bacterium]